MPVRPIDAVLEADARRRGEDAHPCPACGVGLPSARDLLEHRNALHQSTSGAVPAEKGAPMGSCTRNEGCRRTAGHSGRCALKGTTTPPPKPAEPVTVAEGERRAHELMPPVLEPGLFAVKLGDKDRYDLVCVDGVGSILGIADYLTPEQAQLWCAGWTARDLLGVEEVGR